MLTGKSIRAIRRAIGLKQIELAKKSGIDRPRLSTAENGHIRLRQDELAAIQRVIAKERAKQIGKLAKMEERAKE